MEKDDLEVEREAMAALHDAMECPSDERRDFLLSQKSMSDAAKNRALHLLDADPGGVAALRTGGASQQAVEEDDKDPERIGGYRIRRLIARGGMGNVYLGERATGDFDFVVAIKVIKQRLITTEMVERFRRERQILADLGHPNIARLFDGGETEDGAPYFVMEFIEGQPLDRWLSQAQPSFDKRIAIFKQVCGAVEAAHQRLIVHRDLTPSNILIAADDTAKLIDFGIARPDGDAAGGETTLSAFTPGFTAPERHGGSSADTLSDIYSLGKLLKLLLTHDQPEDLVAIARKAAADDSRERYPSVSALAEDIANYQEYRPVSARPGSIAYFLRKFVRRQRLAAAATAIVLTAIIGALILVTQAYRQTEMARAEAEIRLADTRALAGTMMFDVFDEVSNRPGNSEARLMLASNAQRYLEALSEDPNASYDARLAAGRGFYRLAGATGTLGVANAGNFARGIALYERSAEILESLYREAPGDAVRLALARSHIALARDKLLAYIDTQAAPAHADRARLLLLEVDRPTAESLAEYARAERYLGDALACCNDEVEAGSRAIRRAISRIENAPAAHRDDVNVRRSYNDLVNMSAGFRMVAGDDADGIEPFRTALAAQRQLAAETGLPVDHRLEATIASNLARTLLRMGRSEEAGRIIEPTYRRALSSYQADPDDNDLQRRLAITSIVRGQVAAENGERRVASRSIEQGLSLARLSERAGGAASEATLNYAHRLQEASEAYWANGQLSQACDTIRRATSLYRRYAERNDLPMTSLRYRITPMEQRIASCR